MPTSILLENITPDELYSKMRELISEEINKRLKPEPIQLYVTKKEACDKLRISEPTLDRLSLQGTVQKYKIGGRVLFRADEIDQALTQIHTLKYKRG